VGVRYDWSNRLLILALEGILFLTLYPFQFLTHAKGIGHASPFLLGHGGKGSGVRDDLLNVLLFAPFGFALGNKIRKQGRSWPAVLLCTWLAGILLSYGIEFLQLYIPERDSGWEDVLTNSTGAAVGCVIAIFLGGWTFKLLSDWETASEAWLTTRRAAILVLVYFAVWFTASVLLQRETHLENWVSDSYLVIGNDAAGESPWGGRVSLLEIWNHSLPEGIASTLLRGGKTPKDEEPLIKLEFPAPSAAGKDAHSGVPFPSSDSSRLGRADKRGPRGRTPSSEANVPARALVNELKRTNQFSTLLVLRPPETNTQYGSIASISHTSGLPDLYFRHEETNVVFWFRSPLTLRRPALEWNLGHLMAKNELHQVLISYDGSGVSLYVDSRKPRHDAMGPGAALASFVRHVKQSELNGYNYIYYAIVFLLPGTLLGIAMRKQLWRQTLPLVISLSTIVAAPAVLECILVRTNGRDFSFGNFELSVAMVILGILWMNCDNRQMKIPSAAERTA